MARLLGALLLILGGVILAAGLPLWLNAEAETFGDDALLSRPTLLLLALLGLGGLSLVGAGVGLLALA